MIILLLLYVFIFLIILLKNFLFFNNIIKNINYFLLTFKIDIILQMCFKNTKILFISFFINFLILFIFNLIQYEAILSTFFFNMFSLKIAYCMDEQQAIELDIQKKIDDIFQIKPSLNSCFNNYSKIKDNLTGFEDNFDSGYLDIELERVFPFIECLNFKSIKSLNFVETNTLVNPYILGLILDYNNILESRLFFLECLKNFDTTENIIKKNSYINILNEMENQNNILIKKNFNVYSKTILNYNIFHRRYNYALFTCLGDKWGLDDFKINLIKNYIFDYDTTKLNLENLNNNIYSLNIFLSDYNFKLNFLVDFLLKKKYIHLKTCYKNAEFSNELEYQFKKNKNISDEITPLNYYKYYKYHSKPDILEYSIIKIGDNKNLFSKINESLILKKGEDLYYKQNLFLENQIFDKNFQKNLNFQKKIFDKGLIFNSNEKSFLKIEQGEYKQQEQKAPLTNYTNFDKKRKNY